MILSIRDTWIFCVPWNISIFQKLAFNETWEFAILRIIFFTLLYTPTYKNRYTHTQSATVVFKKTSISVSVPFHHQLCTTCPGFPLLYETHTHQKSYLASWLFSIHDTACSLEKWLVMRGTSQASTAEAENQSWLVFVPVAAVSIRGGCWVGLKTRKTQVP